MIQEASTNAPHGWNNNQSKEIKLTNDKKSPKVILTQNDEIITQYCSLFEGDKTTSNKRDRPFPPFFFVFFVFFNFFFSFSYY
jgi:hypothetical protein